MPGAVHTEALTAAPACRKDSRLIVDSGTVRDHQADHLPEVASMAGKFEVYEDRAGKFRFRLKASNGQVVATGEAYETRAAAKKGCESVQKAADGAPVVETDS
jgi:uncharacterized protein